MLYLTLYFVTAYSALAYIWLSLSDQAAQNYGYYLGGGGSFLIVAPTTVYAYYKKYYAAVEVKPVSVVTPVPAAVNPQTAPLSPYMVYPAAPTIPTIAQQPAPPQPQSRTPLPSHLRICMYEPDFKNPPAGFRALYSRACVAPYYELRTAIRAPAPILETLPSDLRLCTRDVKKAPEGYQLRTDLLDEERVCHRDMTEIEPVHIAPAPVPVVPSLDYSVFGSPFTTPTSYAANTPSIVAYAGYFLSTLSGPPSPEYRMCMNEEEEAPPGYRTISSDLCSPYYTEVEIDPAAARYPYPVPIPSQFRICTHEIDKRPSNYDIHHYWLNQEHGACDVDSSWFEILPKVKPQPAEPVALPKTEETECDSQCQEPVEEETSDAPPKAETVGVMQSFINVLFVSIIIASYVTSQGSKASTETKPQANPARPAPSTSRRQQPQRPTRPFRRQPSFYPSSPLPECTTNVHEITSLKAEIAVAESRYERMKKDFAVAGRKRWDEIDILVAQNERLHDQARTKSLDFRYHEGAERQRRWAQSARPLFGSRPRYY